MDSVSWSLYCCVRQSDACVCVCVGVLFGCLFYCFRLKVSSNISTVSGMNFNANMPLLCIPFSTNESMNEHFCSHCFECFSISTDRNYIIFKSGKIKKGKNLWRSIKHTAHHSVIYQMKPRKERETRTECTQTYRVIIIKPKIKRLSGHDFQINSTFALKTKFYCMRVPVHACVRALFICAAHSLFKHCADGNKRKLFPFRSFLLCLIFMYESFKILKLSNRECQILLDHNEIHAARDLLNGK